MSVTAKNPVAVLSLDDEADAAAPFDTLPHGPAVISFSGGTTSGYLEKNAALGLLERLAEAEQGQEVLIIGGRGIQGLDAREIDADRLRVRRLDVRGLAALALTDRGMDRMIGFDALNPPSDLDLLHLGSPDQPIHPAPPPKEAGYLKPGTSLHRAARKRTGAR